MMLPDAVTYKDSSFSEWLLVTYFLSHLLYIVREISITIGQIMKKAPHFAQMTLNMSQVKK